MNILSGVHNDKSPSKKKKTVSVDRGCQNRVIYFVRSFNFLYHSFQCLGLLALKPVFRFQSIYNSDILFPAYPVNLTLIKEQLESQIKSRDTVLLSIIEKSVS
jgi:hypothetical protein